ncbi:MAG: choice-of-anchor L domain-containing protein [Sedimentitalea sp.]
MPLATELPIQTNATAEQMAAEIFGSGITVNSATYSGDPLSSGIYTNGDTISPDATPGDSGVILSTGHAEDFTNDSGTTNTNISGSTSTNTVDGIDGDDDFDDLAGAFTRDAAILEVTFTPLGDTITLDFVLSSEEYPEFINSVYNDVVGVWVNDVQATVTVGDGSASIGNINGGATQNIYNDNTGDQFNTEMDGFTVTLTFVAPVTPGEENTLKVGVADVGDASYDTNLLIAGGSVQSTIIAQDDEVTLGHNDTKTLDVLDNDSSTGGTLTITHINGTAVIAGQSITLATGQVITLNGDGTITVEGDSDAETIYFNYSIEDQAGNTDTAIVEIEQIPCFTAGTLIETNDGPRQIETLQPGDLIMTRDAGALPLRWIGQNRVNARGPHCPVLLRAGVLGLNSDLRVSQQHRILLSGPLCQLLFSTPEVLVKSKDLLPLSGVSLDTSYRDITYCHLLFDQHQIVKTQGLDSESYLPGPATMSGFDAATQSEILTLFPQLSSMGYGYGPAARPVLKTFEAQLLIAMMANQHDLLQAA